MIFILCISSHYQPLNHIHQFYCLLYQTRKVLSLLGFENVNPENNKFQKKSYLD